MYGLPLPKPENIPPDLMALVAQMMRFKDQQKAYGETPLAQHLWPGADLQYVASPPNLRNLVFGGALQARSGQPLDARVGAEYRLNF